jgi:glyoxylase-like metal-dependent hydrolase (beta-lactamase superfamily II)
MNQPTKAFASQADLADKVIKFEQLSKHCWAYTAEGDPNSGVIIGDKFIMVSDATATPGMARDLIKQIRTISDKPIKYVLLTHYHAVRVLGASAYAAEGATEVIASQGTYELIIERGAQDMKSEMERFPRLFRGAEEVPGLTWPTMVIGGGDATKGEVPGKLVVDLGGVKVQILEPWLWPYSRRHHCLGGRRKSIVLWRLGRVRSGACTPATPNSKNGPLPWKLCAP